MVTGRPMTAAEHARIRKLHAEGKSCSAIASDLGRSKATISLFCKREGLDFSRRGLENAIAATVFDAKATRRRIIEKLYARSEYLIEQMDATKNGGTFTTLRKVGMGEESTAHLHHVPPADEKNIANSIVAYLARAEALEKLDADGGMTEAKGMVGHILAAIVESVSGVPRMNVTAPPAESKTE